MDLDFVFNDEWFSCRRIVLIRLYTVHNISFENFSSDSIFEEVNIFNNEKIFLRFISYSSENEIFYFDKAFSNSLGDLKIGTFTKVTPVEQGLYLFIATPLSDYERSVHYEERKLLDRYIAKIRLTYGNNAARHLFYERAIHLDTNHFREYAAIFEKVHTIEGPVDDSQINSRRFLPQISSPSCRNSDKINRALEFFSNAQKFDLNNYQAMRFVLYRSALEILVGSYKDNIAFSHFKKIYKTRWEAKYDLKRIWLLRHKIIHQGIDISFTVGDDIYIQSLIKDCIIFELREDEELDFLYLEKYLDDYEYDPKLLGFRERGREFFAP